MLTIRLDKETEQELEYLKIKRGISKSELVKEALDLYLKSEKDKLSAYELGKDLFGVGEGDIDSSINVKEKIKARLHGKFAH